MKLYKFPDVNNEKWDGSGLKKKHLKNLAKTSKEQEEINAQRRVLERLEARLFDAEVLVSRLKREVEKQRKQYFKLFDQGDAE